MRPLFTIHAGEFLVGQYIESKFANQRVWIPTKDTGVDLLVTNANATRAVSLQVKFSRDFLPVMKLKPVARKNLRSCTWFYADRERLLQSEATFWIFVLLGFEEHSYDYLLIKPRDLARRLERLHGKAKRYQIYFWVTKRKRAWLTRNISAKEQEEVAAGTFKDTVRDVSRHLNDWRAVHRL